MLDYLTHVFQTHAAKEAIVWKGQTFTYAQLLEMLDAWQTSDQLKEITSGQVVVLEADFSPQSVCLFLILMHKQCILVPLTAAVEAKKREWIKIAQADVRLTLDDQDQFNVETLSYGSDHAYYQTLRERAHAGLVLFSSGSTGQSKAVVHDLVKLCEKFQKPRKLLRTISFLLYDHIGGVNTMLYTLANGGCLITVEDRRPETILKAVQEYEVELLPVSPTFLNLLLVSKQYENYDMSSLQLITYGTEPMPEATLQQLSMIFPNIKLTQTYGLSEVGILSSQSKANDSLWMKVGGEGFETRVVDGLLEIKSESAMLGYLNAPSPFTDDGWFQTGDAVEVDGDFIKVLGRTSELINVGGEKVYPQEVENVILQMPEVADVTVYGEKNMLMGHIVCAKVCLSADVSYKDFPKKLQQHCVPTFRKF